MRRPQLILYQGVFKVMTDIQVDNLVHIASESLEVLSREIDSSSALETQEELTILNLKLELCDRIIKEIESFAKKFASTSRDLGIVSLNKELGKLRFRIERKQRQLTLRQPPNQQEFEATLMWITENGKEEEELKLIQELKKIHLILRKGFNIYSMLRIRKSQRNCNIKQNIKNL